MKNTDYTNKTLNTKTLVKLNSYGYYRNTKSHISQLAYFIENILRNSCKK